MQHGVDLLLLTPGKEVYMKNVHDLQKEIFRLEKSGKLSVDLSEKLRKHLKKIEHSVATRKHKEIRKYVFEFCEMLLEVS